MQETHALGRMWSVLNHLISRTGNPTKFFHYKLQVALIKNGPGATLKMACVEHVHLGDPKTDGTPKRISDAETPI